MLIGFERMADEMSALVFTATPAGELDYVNRWCLEYLGAGDRRDVSAQWADWVHPDDLDGVLADRDESVSSGDVYERVQRLRRHDGEYRWHSVSARPVLDDDGEVVVWVGVAVDAHDRVTSEQARAQSEERFRRLAEVTADVVFDWDMAADLVWFSNDLASLTGDALPAWDRGVSIDALLDLVHPDDLDRVRADMAAAVANATMEWSTSFRFVRAAGTVIAIGARGAVVRDGVGRPVRLIGSLEDRSAQLRLEEQLARSQQLDTFADFASGLAHELNNVFAVVIGGADELVSGLDDRPELRELVLMSSEAVRRGASLIDDLVAFSGRHRLAPAEIDVRRALDSVARLVRQALGRGITIEVQCEEGLGGLRTDAERLESSLFNLCLNASDAMPNGGRITMRATDVTVATEAGEDDAAVVPGDYVLIEVSDDGRGMAPDIRARAVDPMFTTKDRSTHAGLGLSAVHGFATQSGGHLSIVSEEHRGTTVSVYLPRTAAGAATATTDADAAAGATTTAPDSHPAPGPSEGGGTGGAQVLVVDDNDGVRSMISKQLARHHYSVIEARDAPDALAVLASGAAVDVVVSDVVMPGELDGFDVARHARRQHPDIAVILTSGHIVPGGGGVPDDLGDVDVLAKPYRFADLLARIAALVERH